MAGYNIVPPGIKYERTDRGKMNLYNVADYLGIDLNMAVLGIVGLSAVVVILIILQFIHVIQMSKLKKKYKLFMSGEDGKSLEALVSARIEKMDDVIKTCEDNKNNIASIAEILKSTFQKVGLVKYDAFNEMGGKLSFSLALLDSDNNGFIINAMHSREGCYTYIKEIVDGNSIIVLSGEEQEALTMALDSRK